MIKGINKNTRKLLMISPESQRIRWPNHFQRIVCRSIDLPTEQNSPNCIRNCRYPSNFCAINYPMNRLEVGFEDFPCQCQWFVAVDCVRVGYPVVLLFLLDPPETNLDDLARSLLRNEVHQTKCEICRRIGFDVKEIFTQENLMGSTSQVWIAVEMKC